MGKTSHDVQAQKSNRIDFVQVSRDQIFDGHLVLINRSLPIQQPLLPSKLLPLSSNASLKLLEKDISLENTCCMYLMGLLEACKGTEEIIAVSGYRTKEEQEHIYQSSLIENGEAYTGCYVALPDRSEHQTGLAIDVGEWKENVDFIAPSFPDSGVCMTFKQLAAPYGFVQRYKEGKESITNISCEPWHFRYVGQPHAEIMEQHDFCLEEYIDFIQGYPYSGDHLTIQQDQLSVEIYYVPFEERSYMDVPIVACDYYHLSGDNEDGIIITAFTDQGE